VTQASQSNHLPIVLAVLRQQCSDGELVLEQNDGLRRLYWRKGELVYLQSDAAGEQFGNYLIRRGILDYAGLNQLLASEDRARLGDKVVQWGMLTVDDRDSHLRELQEQVMVNALEHPILQLTWNPTSASVMLSEDLHLKLDHRHFIWNTFLEAHNLDPTYDLLHNRTDWKWEGIPHLLEALSDLPLNPATAYALSFLGSEPISFDTFLSLSSLDEEDAARIFLILWAVGALTLTQGELPRLESSPGPPAPPPPPPRPPPPPPPPPPAGGVHNGYFCKVLKIVQIFGLVFWAAWALKSRSSQSGPFFFPSWRLDMDMATIRNTAREALKGYCRVCPVCDGRACAGEVPGMGGTGTGAAFKDNLEALRRHRLNLRTLHAVKTVDTALELFGKTLSMPILAAPMAGTTYNMGGKMSEAQFIASVIGGAKDAGTFGMCGDGADAGMYESGLAAIAAAGGLGAAILKPRTQEEVVRRMRMAEEAHALAVGMDVDGAGLVTMALKGQPVGPKTPEELAAIIGEARLPFIVKGVMTVDEALVAVQAGAAAIVVSNHGGRVLDHTPGTAEVLPGIAAMVKGKTKILVDGGVRSGADVLKMLALGADAVLVGRPLVTGAFGGGAEGVAFLLNKLKAELTGAMLLTGTASVRNVSPEILSPRPC